MTTTQDRRPVVVGVDGAEHSTAALRHALSAARERGVGVRLVHVAPGFRPVMPHVLMMETDLAAVGRHLLRDAEAQARELAPDVVVKPSLRRGTTVLELVAASESAQLLVLGSESMHGLDRVLLGTTTAGVAAHAVCPVRVVPAQWTDRPGPVVVGLRTTDQVDTLVGEGVRRAAGRGDHVVVVHAWHLPDPYADRIEVRAHTADWQRAGHDALAAAIDPLRRRHPEIRFDIRVVHADPVTALLDVPDASLIVIERRRRTSWLPGSLGRTARHLLARSAVPVEVVAASALPPDEGAGPREDAGAAGVLSGTRERS